MALQRMLVLAEKIEFHGVHHVGILVKDLKKAKAFYCDTLGKCTYLTNSVTAAVYNKNRSTNIHAHRVEYQHGPP